MSKPVCRVFDRVRHKPGYAATEAGQMVKILEFETREMSLVVRKPVFGVSDQVPHKPGCTATEDG